MIIRFALVVLLCQTLIAEQPGDKRPRVGRAALASLEKSFDDRISSFSVEDPLDLVGPTRGIYLENYGVVFTAEVNLVIAAITPFRPSYTPAQVKQLHQKKLNRLIPLKQAMRDSLQRFAQSLPTVPPNEHVVLSVSLVHQPWELKSDLPQQILMQATRQMLTDHYSGKIDNAAFMAALKVEEF